MMIANRAREWFLLGVIFALLPALFFFFVALRGRRNMNDCKARQIAAEQRLQAIVPVQPLSAHERGLLSDTAAWRGRMPYLEGDAARLWHYHHTVTELQRVLKQGGVLTGSIRSSFDPIQGSFSLPTGLAEMPGEQALKQMTLGRPQAWVLEVSVEGSSVQLFQVLDLLPRVEPLLEPIALRWEATPEGHKQFLILRNLVLVPVA
jgi:hypothetical protein